MPRIVVTLSERGATNLYALLVRVRQNVDYDNESERQTLEYLLRRLSGVQERDA